MAISAALSKMLQLGSGSPEVTPAAFELAMRSMFRQELDWQNDAGAGVITAGTALEKLPAEDYPEAFDWIGRRQQKRKTETAQTI